MSEKVDIEINSNLKEAAEGAEELKEELKETKEAAKDVGEESEKAGKKGGKGFAMLRNGARSFGTALKAMGIGIIVGALALLAKGFSTNSKVMTKVNAIIGTITGVVSEFVSVLVDTFNWITASGERFDAFGKVVKGLLTIALYPLRLTFQGLKLGVLSLMKAYEESFLGSGDTTRINQLTNDINETKQTIADLTEKVKEAGTEVAGNFMEAVSEIGDAYNHVAEGTKKIDVKKIYETAEGAAKLANDAKLAAAELQGLVEKYDRQAELQRQIRDDESKTFAERIAANQQLLVELEEQEKLMLKQADVRIAAARAELALDKENIDLQVALKEAVNERAAVEAQITGFMSEQKTNQVALEKELLEVQNEIRQEGLSGLEKELLELENSYNEKLRMAKKAGEETTAITEQYEKQKSQIVAENTATQLAAYSGLIGNLGKLAGENKALAIAQAIIDTYAGANKAFAQGGTVGFVTAAAVITAGLNNVRQIMKQDVGGGSGGSVGAPTEMKPPNTGAFSFNNTQQEPVKAYVVESEITNSQAQMADINRRSTI